MQESSRIKWPNGAACAVMLSFDFDAESNWMARDSDNFRRPGVISQGTYGAKVGIHKILSLLAQAEIHATFFVPGWVADNRTDTVAKIRDAGHELAIHGYHHTSVQPDDYEKERVEFERAFQSFANQLTVTPRGYRAPYGDITTELLDLLTSHEILYDSSLMDDIAPYRLSLPDGTSGPVELPWHWSLDDAAYMLHSLTVLRPIFTNSHVLSIWTEEFAGAYEESGFIDLLMHPQFSGRPSRLQLLRDFIEHARGYQDVWFATASQIALAWQEVESTSTRNKISPFGLDYQE